MKKYIITLALAPALLTGCTSDKVALENLRGEISWNAFCDARGYDRTDNTYSAVNEYLDTWCGSVDEEAALIEAGVEPF